MDLQLSHLGICVSDLDASLRFWCDGLGFRAAERFELGDDTLVGLDRALEVTSPVRVVSQFVRSDALAIELLAYAEPDVTGAPSASRGRLGMTHLAFTVDDVVAAAAHLAAHGGTVLEHTRAELGVELLFVADPDGNRVELMGRPS